MYKLIDDYESAKLKIEELNGRMETNLQASVQYSSHEEANNLRIRITLNRLIVDLFPIDRLEKEDKLGEAIAELNKIQEK
jgi:hypothetical protein